MVCKDKDGNWITTVGVVSQEQYGAGQFHFGASFADGSLERVIASLNEIRDSIPEEYRAVARCEISSVSGWEGEHYASIEVEYPRPATGGEITAAADRREAVRLAEISRLRSTLTSLEELSR